jgi:DNA-binding transcriptional ArsR family regulator
MITEAKELADAFKALSDLTRLRILYLLATDTTGTLGVSDLAAQLGISQPAVSQHLKVLKHEGIVASERSGFHVYFTFNRERMSWIAEHFEHMRLTVFTRCDQQLIREQNPAGPLNLCIICYSYSNITRTLMRKIQAVCGGEFVDVHTVKNYSTFTVYTTGVLRSRQEESDPISPDIIDVSGYDLIVIATPVWAWKPAPAANAIVAGLSGCEGKKAVICVTYSNNPGECIPLLKKKLQERGVGVRGEMAMSRKDCDDPHKRNDLISMIIRAYQDES